MPRGVRGNKTNKCLTPEKLTGHSEEEVKLYDLIWRQFIACQMPDANIYQLMQKSF